MTSWNGHNLNIWKTYEPSNFTLTSRSCLLKCNQGVVLFFSPSASDRWSALERSTHTRRIWRKYWRWHICLAIFSSPIIISPICSGEWPGNLSILIIDRRLQICVAGCGRSHWDTEINQQFSASSADVTFLHSHHNRSCLRWRFNLNCGWSMSQSQTFQSLRSHLISSSTSFTFRLYGHQRPWLLSRIQMRRRILKTSLSPFPAAGKSLQRYNSSKSYVT